MNTKDFEVVEALLREMFAKKGYNNFGLTGAITNSKGESYYLVRIDEEAIESIKYFGSVSETLEQLEGRCEFRLYLNEIEDFLNM